MTAGARTVIGSETQAHQTHTFSTGVQRVIRETHGGLFERLDPLGIDLVPFHTRNDPASDRYLRSAYLAADPVLKQPLHEMEDIDVQLYLDINNGVDFGRLFRQRRQHPVPMIFMLHDLLPIQHPEWFLPHAAPHFRVYLQQVLRVADHIVVPSGSVRSQLLSLGWHVSQHVHVLHLGTTFDQQPPTSAPAEPLALLYVSTLEPRKGHDLLLGAFDILRADGVAVELNIVGRQGWEAEGITRRITEHPEYRSTLHWHSSGDDALVRELAGRSHIGVMPSRDEGFGLFVEESLSLGLKAVASRVPVFLERAQANLSFSDLSAAGLAEAILAAHAAPQRYLEQGSVRTMNDFAGDLSELILSVIP